MVFENGVKNIQAAAYNGARTVVRNLITNQKKLKIFFFVKTQNNDLFISPKRKNATLEMALKSFILSKVDHQMSKS